MRTKKRYQLDPSCIYFRRIKGRNLVVEICHLKYQRWLRVTGLAAKIVDDLQTPKSPSELLLGVPEVPMASRKTLQLKIDQLLSQLKRQKIIRSV